MESGEWYVHKRADEELYFVAVESQKNGGVSGILATIDLERPRSKAKLKKYSVSKYEASRLAPEPGSFWRWIDGVDLPEKVKEQLP